MSQEISSVWNLRFEDGAGTTLSTYADGLDGTEPTAPVGESVDLRLIFRAASTDDYATRYDQLLEICRSAAGEYEIFDGDSRTLFTETNTFGEPSPVLGVEPEYYTPTTPGLWVLVDDIEAETSLHQTVCILSIGATVIAESIEYSDIASLRSDRSYSAF